MDLYTQFKDRIRVVLLDLILPKVSGFEVFRRIRALAPNEKIVIISGYSEDQQLRDIMSEGVDAFVKKPCSAGSLASALAEVLCADAQCDESRVTMSCVAPTYLDKKE